MNTPITDAVFGPQLRGYRAETCRRLELDRAALMEALEKLLQRDMRNTCRHEETHRGGAIWEICDQCDTKWADDCGGKPEWHEPPEWTLAESTLSAARANFPEP